ncbi:MAG: glycosyltransferase family 2 protein [Magnetococcus sp. WYHC-3]
MQTNTVLPSISVVMPALNEEGNVEDAVKATLAAFEHYDVDGEVLVVDDGSTDDTAAVVRRLMASDTRVRLHQNGENRGLGASYWIGCQQATKDFVTMIPGDNENDPVEVLRYIHLTRDVDIIVPFIMNAEVRNTQRRIISALYRFIINFSFGTQFNYTNGTVIYNRHILRDVELETSGFFYQAELLVKLVRIGYFYAEVPALLAQRGRGQTKAIAMKSLKHVVKGYLSLFRAIHLSRSAGAPQKRLHPQSVSAQRYETVDARM